MIDPKLVDFVHAAEFFVVGTRDAKLRSHGAHVMGARIDGSTGILSIFVPHTIGEQAIEDLKATKRAAITCSEAAHHETYQFKGDVVEIRPISDAEGAVQEVYLAKLGGALQGAGFPVQNWKFPPMRPCSTVLVRVTDIFFQSPGPRAGERIGP